MAKVRMFARKFLKGHPKEGQPTYFVEKIWQALYKNGLSYGNELLTSELEIFSNPSHYIHPKHHTIRAGKHFKEGDYFSPRVWSNRPYSSKQLSIAPDLLLHKVFDIEILVDDDYICIMIDDFPFYEENKEFVTQLDALKTLALNDGLQLQDFRDWFKWGKPFSGQILCWSKGIVY